MFLTTLSTPIIIVLLGALGGLSGSLINWAIYRWGAEKWQISPWSPAPDKSDGRKWSDRIPVLGWFGIRRDEQIHGRLFWIRPLFIELVWVVGLPWFYFWQLGGGLTGGWIPDDAELWNRMAETWFWSHSILIALMFIATFIDFDQKLIPDWITVPGTLIGLSIAATAPVSRLPMVRTLLKKAEVDPLQYCTPEGPFTWHHGHLGMLLGILILGVWVYALYPRYPASSIKSYFVGLVRILRGNKRGVRINECRRQALGLIAVFLLGAIAIIAFWQINPRTENSIHYLDSLMGALLGLAGGGIVVWSIRIVGNATMGREAMGFGDVTLLAMVGAFLGWHASLLVFGFAPFAALLIAVTQFIFTRKPELAFGPYLCLGALMLILFWKPTWEWAAKSIFYDLQMLFIIGVVYLVALGGTLFALQLLKRGYYGDELEDDSEQVTG